MSYVAGRLIRVPLVVAVIALILIAIVPLAMRFYDPFPIGRATPAVSIAIGPLGTTAVVVQQRTLAAVYQRPFLDLMVDATPCAMFPALAVHTPRASDSRDASDIALLAPRILNEPIGWRHSSLR